MIPATNDRDKKVKRFNFIEAVTRLPPCFSKAEIATIMKSVGKKFMGRLRSIFIVISDDMRDAHIGMPQVAQEVTGGVEVEDNAEADPHVPSGSKGARKRYASVSANETKSSKSAKANRH